MPFKDANKVTGKMEDIGNRTDGTSDEKLPEPTKADRDRLLGDLLKGVSRAFYLTLRVLPRGLREPVALAYLLARATDTIADTRVLPSQERLQCLIDFRAQVEGPAALPVIERLRSRVGGPAVGPESELLEALPKAFALLEALSPADRVRVRAVVVTLTRGMEIDLTTFLVEDSGRVTAFANWAELDRYTYFVAGCVGEFWTEIAKARIPSLKRWDPVRMSGLGVGFGKALQMTNVVRDVPRDLRAGRCYLPEEEFAKLGLSPEDLLDPAASDRARPVLSKALGLTLEHYRAAEQYLYAVPRRSLRMRLALLWPLLMGLATISMVARNRAWLDPEGRAKVSRPWVYWMMLRSLPCALSNGLTRTWIGSLRRAVEKRL